MPTNAPAPAAPLSFAAAPASSHAPAPAAGLSARELLGANEQLQGQLNDLLRLNELLRLDILVARRQLGDVAALEGSLQHANAVATERLVEINDLKRAAREAQAAAAEAARATAESAMTADARVRAADAATAAAESAAQAATERERAVTSAAEERVATAQQQLALAHAALAERTGGGAVSAEAHRHALAEAAEARAAAAAAMAARDRAVAAHTGCGLAMIELSSLRRDAGDAKRVYTAQEKLRGIVLALESELKEARKDCKTLEDLSTTRLNAIGEWRDKFTAVYADHHGCAAAATEAAAEIAALRERAEAAEARAAAAEAKAAVAHAEKVEVATTLERATETQTLRVAELSSRVEQLTVANTTLEVQHATVSREAVARVDRSAALAREVKVVEKARDEALAEVETLKGRLTAVTARADKTEARARAVASENDAVRVKLAEAEAGAARAHETLAVVQTSADRRTREVELLTQRSELHAQSTQRTHEAMAALETRLANYNDLVAQLGDTREKLAATVAKLEAVSADARQLAAVHAATTEDLRRVSQAHAELESRSAGVSMRNAQVERRLTDQASDLGGMKTDYLRVVAELVRHERAALAARCANVDLQEAVAALAARLGESNRRGHALAARVREREAQLAALAQRLDDAALAGGMALQLGAALHSSAAVHALVARANDGSTGGGTAAVAAAAAAAAAPRKLQQIAVSLRNAVKSLEPVVRATVARADALAAGNVPARDASSVPGLAFLSPIVGPLQLDALSWPPGTAPFPLRGLAPAATAATQDAHGQPLPPTRAAPLASGAMAVLPAALAPTLPPALSSVTPWMPAPLGRAGSVTSGVELAVHVPRTAAASAATAPQQLQEEATVTVDGVEAPAPALPLPLVQRELEPVHEQHQQQCGDAQKRAGSEKHNGDDNNTPTSSTASARASTGHSASSSANLPAGGAGNRRGRAAGSAAATEADATSPSPLKQGAARRGGGRSGSRTGTRSVQNAANVAASSGPATPPQGPRTLPGQSRYSHSHSHSMSITYSPPSQQQQQSAAPQYATQQPTAAAVTGEISVAAAGALAAPLPPTTTAVAAAGETRAAAAAILATMFPPIPSSAYAAATAATTGAGAGVIGMRGDACVVSVHAGFTPSFMLQLLRTVAAQADAAAAAAADQRRAEAQLATALRNNAALTQALAEMPKMEWTAQLRDVTAALARTNRALAAMEHEGAVALANDGGDAAAAAADPSVAGITVPGVGGRVVAMSPGKNAKAIVDSNLAPRALQDQGSEWEWQRLPQMGAMANATAMSMSASRPVTASASVSAAAPPGSALGPRPRPVARLALTATGVVCLPPSTVAPAAASASAADDAAAAGDNCDAANAQLVAATGTAAVHVTSAAAAELDATVPVPVTVAMPAAAGGMPATPVGLGPAPPVRPAGLDDALLALRALRAALADTRDTTAAAAPATAARSGGPSPLLATPALAATAREFALDASSPLSALNLQVNELALAVESHLATAADVAALLRVANRACALGLAPGAQGLHTLLPRLAGLARARPQWAAMLFEVSQLVLCARDTLSVTAHFEGTLLKGAAALHRTALAGATSTRGLRAAVLNKRTSAKSMRRRSRRSTVVAAASESESESEVVSDADSPAVAVTGQPSKSEDDDASASESESESESQAGSDALASLPLPTVGQPSPSASPAPSDAAASAATTAESEQSQAATPIARTDSARRSRSSRPPTAPGAAVVLTVSPHDDGKPKGKGKNKGKGSVTVSRRPPLTIELSQRLPSRGSDAGDSADASENESVATRAPLTTLSSAGTVSMSNLHVLRDQILTVSTHPQYAAPLRGLAGHIADLLAAVEFMYDRQVELIEQVAAAAPVPAVAAAHGSEADVADMTPM